MTEALNIYIIYSYKLSIRRQIATHFAKCYSRNGECKNLHKSATLISREEANNNLWGKTRVWSYEKHTEIENYRNVKQMEEQSYILASEKHEYIFEKVS